MADDRIYNLPSGVSILDTSVFYTDKSGEASGKQVSYTELRTAIEDYLFADSGFLEFENFQPFVAASRNQIRQVGKQVSGYLRINVGASFTGTTICELPIGIDVPSDDIRMYATTLVGTVIIKECFVDVSERTIVFETTPDVTNWLIKIVYSA